MSLVDGARMMIGPASKRVHETACIENLPSPYPDPPRNNLLGSAWDYCGRMPDHRSPGVPHSITRPDSIMTAMMSLMIRVQLSSDMLGLMMQMINSFNDAVMFKETAT